MTSHRFSVSIMIILALSLVITGCSSQDATIENPAPATPPTTAPTLELTAPPTKPPASPTLPEATIETASAGDSPSAFPLSQPGPYFPGKRYHTITREAERGGGEFDITIWYPAIQPADYKGTLVKDGQPDTNGAPYPLLLTATIFGNEYAAHLATYGFVVAGVDYQVPSELFGNWLIDHPLDLLRTLDQLGTNPPVEMVGMLDTDHSGVLGYSTSGHVTLEMSGARVDPQYYLDRCALGPDVTGTPTEDVTQEQVYRYFCSMAETWNDFTAYAGEAITASEDGLWQPIMDERIRAIMPSAPDLPWEYGERGLATASLPALMICGTDDYRETDYESACVFTYENLGSPEKTLISFIDQNHLMVFDVEPKARINHFTTAFFGYHLQGKEEYQQYYSQDFVSQFDDLVWGVYVKP